MGLPNADEEVVDNFIDNRSKSHRGSLSDHPLQPGGSGSTEGSAPGSVPSKALPSEMGASRGGSKGRVLTIHAEGRVDSGPVTAVEVTVVRQSRSRQIPFKVVQWERFPVNQASSLFSGTAIDSEMADHSELGDSTR